MKRTKRTAKPDPDTPAEIDFSKGVRGKYAAMWPKGDVLMVVLDPELSAVFRDAETVQRYLRLVASVLDPSTIASTASTGVRRRKAG